MSSEAGSKDCPGVSAGQADGFFFFLNMVFIKKASISREVWFSSEARQGRLPPAFSNNAVIDAAFEMYIVF